MRFLHKFNMLVPRKGKMVTLLRRLVFLHNYALLIACAVSSQYLRKHQLRGRSTLVDKNYKTWDTAVADALLATGMYALYTVTTRQRDDELPAQDVRLCGAIPQWQLNIAWSAIRHAIGSDSPAYALTDG